MIAIYQKNFEKVKKYFEIIKNTTTVECGKLRKEYPLPHEDITWSLSPWSDNYFSPIANINLFEVTNPSQLYSYDCIIIRDGLLTFVDFFNRFPKPQVFKPVFIVHVSLKDFVPESWKGKIVFFDYYYKENDFENSNRDKLIIKGHVKRGFLNLDELKGNLQAHVSKNHYSNVYICTTIRESRFLYNQYMSDTVLVNEYRVLKEILDGVLVKNKIKFEYIDWKSFYEFENCKDFYFLDINLKPLIYVDDSSSHFLLKRGAMPIFMSHGKKNKSRKSEEDLEIPLTLNHGVVILKNEPISQRLHSLIQEEFNFFNIKPFSKLNKTGFEIVFNHGTSARI